MLDHEKLIKIYKTRCKKRNNDIIDRKLIVCITRTLKPLYIVSIVLSPINKSEVNRLFFDST